MYTEINKTKHDDIARELEEILDHSFIDKTQSGRISDPPTKLTHNSTEKRNK